MTQMMTLCRSHKLGRSTLNPEMMYLGKIKSSKTSARRFGLMPDYTMRDDWICFTHVYDDGGELYIETKLKTTVEADMQAAIDMMELTNGGG
tara:strand:- start:619 stop:894 length:276 start_codon:yes stop_codon:yes gene_type:complete